MLCIIIPDKFQKIRVEIKKNDFFRIFWKDNRFCDLELQEAIEQYIIYYNNNRIKQR